MRKGTDTDLIKDRQNMREGVWSRDWGGDEGLLPSVLAAALGVLDVQKGDTESVKGWT